MTRSLPTTMLCLLVCLLLLAAAPLEAAEITDVLDAADGEDTLDFRLTVGFTQEYEWAMITRERSAGGPLSDPSGGTVQMINQEEYVYKAVKNLMNINGRIGLYKDLEFHFTLPVHIEELYEGHLSGHWRSKYWGGANNQPSLMADKVFGYSAWRSIHKGFGDMTMGFSYSPVTQSRDENWPSWILSLDMLIPSGEEQNPKMEPAAASGDKGIGNNIQVGEKLFAFIFKTAISYRSGVAEPYFGVHYKLPIATGDLIDNPRHEGGFTLGTELIAYEKLPENSSEPIWKVTFDFRFDFDMIGRGQDFNEITDMLAWRRQSTLDGFGIPNAWPTDPRSQLADVSSRNTFYNYPDINGDGQNDAPPYKLPTEDRYAHLKGTLGFSAILYHYVFFRSEVSFAHRTDHYLSLPGRIDSSSLRPVMTGDGSTQMQSGYNAQINETGARVRLEKSFVVAYTLTIGVNY